MSVREYIGARYVPLFVGEWDIDNEYEPLSIVTHEGDSYTSRQAVPVGIQITNDAYWAPTGSYNAQITQYRQEVAAMSNSLPSTDFDSTHTVKDAIDAVASQIDDIEDSVDDLNDALPSTDFDANNTVSDAIDSIKDILPASNYTSVNTVKKAIDTVSSNVTVVSDRLERLHLALNHFVVIGDSFSTVANNITSTQIWWYKMGLQLRMTPHSYAANGMGYIRGTKTFAQQLAAATVDSSYDHDDVGYVIIFGSLNDCYQSFTTSAYEDAVNAVITGAHAEFPNAEIVVVGINTSYYAFSVSGWSTPGGLTIQHSTRALEQTLAKCTFEKAYARFVPFARCMIGVEDWFQSNHHPTATGQSVICNAIRNAITGNGMAFKYNRTTTANAIFGSGTLAFYWNDSKFGWYANSATGAQTGTSTGNYCVAFAIPYGLETMLDISPSNNSIISIAATKEWPREAMAYGYITDTLPSYISYTPDASKYGQSYLIQATPDASSVGIHSCS